MKKIRSSKIMQIGEIGSDFVFAVVAVLIVAGIAAIGGFPSMVAPQNGTQVQIVTPAASQLHNSLQLETFGYTTIVPTVPTTANPTVQKVMAPSTQPAISISPTQSLEKGGSRSWIMSLGVLKTVTANPQSKEALTNDTLYVTGANPANLPATAANLHIIPARGYTSEEQFANAISANSIPSYVKAILYDNEHWSLTPLIEQQNIVAYYQKAYTLAHSHGLLLIATPGDQKIIPQIAPFADVVDIQAQEIQANVQTYINLVGPIAQQAKQTNPHIIVLSGLSTNPRAGDPTPQQLLAIAQATYGTVVQGWWLNIPKPSTSCPLCNPPMPDTAISF